MSQVAGCVAHAHEYHLSKRDASDIINRQIDVITTTCRRCATSRA